MIEKIVCEKCGTEMVDRSVGYSICVECPSCGWGWATHANDPTNDDRTPYEVWLKPGNSQSTDLIRLVAGIAGVNFVQARTILSCESPVMIYRAHHEPVVGLNTVRQIQKVAHALTDAGIQFSITPDFPYASVPDGETNA